MNYDVHGFTDMHTLITNERKLGGAIEANRIRLSTGEEFTYPVITNVDYSGATFYSIGFISDEGEHYIVNVHDISIMTSTRHCPIKELKNSYCKKLKTKQRIDYLIRLCEVNEGSFTQIFWEEVQAILDDIGMDAIERERELKQLNKEFNSKIIKIA
ncbi:hypothetical protein [Alkalihalobacillus sp. AL-G]|uniref:hypothetical protein n=1 Tax=Alkalihalobacillus sp. AL-G TaxID=2926399 RepID=UPI00272A0F58|nr:hypothetical protein [Alkalihalobacillus sp. AL-G]WLD91961.1 hypothetical protein MOJ78_13050 [Alkalihalobacillus sp. AL-G]